MTEGKLKEFIAAWERKDVPGLMQFIADDCLYVTTTGPAPGCIYRGKQEIEDAFTDQLSAPNDGSYDSFGPLFVADTWGVLEWSSTSMDQQNNPVTMRGCDLYEFNGDLITRKDVFRKVFG